jgi:hypothetical protein
MNKMGQRLRGAGGFIAGALIGVSIWVPVFAATANAPQWQAIGMLAAAILFGIGLWLHAALRAEPQRGARSPRVSTGRAPRGVRGRVFVRLDCAKRCQRA